MKDFVIIGHKALTTGDFSLNDLPGSAGRMDILCRCVNSALFLSHGMRRDVNVHLVLQGEPDPAKIVRFNGEKLKYLNPDERSSGSLIKKALEKDAIEYEIQSTPGVFIRRAGLEELLKEFSEAGRDIYYLREDGKDIMEYSELNSDAVFVLGDHMGVTEEEEEMIDKVAKCTLNIGPISLHSDHCMIIIHNELDRKEA
ncbi:tRNA (pseudouridine54-N1)-methyltransferase [Methanolobus vulcani]|jgi:tRNA (pseudouridine54-N1)-methyltransferase|uniref:tRNA (pseudouridine(54)-N(1))-methyltransferase n=1 Tax=Methanolobus vulcani TaxID=38026 RepID=A0A7Z7AWE3_9EURY|nr:tRNA (pseudouridine(54)-N(1))-methyltransferase TrmY [Methanolobus vulcani]MDK2826847.1 tRNA (pseudouridine54-N1)-methyltransferase [Methanolobus sp.]MDK2948794.1 tRNA (pseudouridine54-N1)-methyltransferase [Methanolobus sp.]SDF80974.1 tRNA (pseudouridine54-N1)-methyltransferase [Methanolobus vulcani]